MSSYAHVHDDAMRPNGSDLLKADRLKAGGIKPGTWALNSPVAAAIPTARETTAVAAKPGLRRKIRSAYRRSTARISSMKFPQQPARKNTTTGGVISHDEINEGRLASPRTPPQERRYLSDASAAIETGM